MVGDFSQLVKIENLKFLGIFRYKFEFEIVDDSDFDFPCILLVCLFVCRNETRKTILLPLGGK